MVDLNPHTVALYSIHFATQDRFLKHLYALSKGHIYGSQCAIIAICLMLSS